MCVCMNIIVVVLYAWGGQIKYKKRRKKDEDASFFYHSDGKQVKGKGEFKNKSKSSGRTKLKRKEQPYTTGHQARHTHLHKHTVFDQLYRNATGNFLPGVELPIICMVTLYVCERGACMMMWIYLPLTCFDHPQAAIDAPSELWNGRSVSVASNAPYD